jgi:hypothetical protein
MMGALMVQQRITDQNYEKVCDRKYLAGISLMYERTVTSLRFIYSLTCRQCRFVLDRCMLSAAVIR